MMDYHRVRVRPYGVTHIATCKGKSASCTHSPLQAALTVARKAFGSRLEGIRELPAQRDKPKPGCVNYQAVVRKAEQ